MDIYRTPHNHQVSLLSVKQRSLRQPDFGFLLVPNGFALCRPSVKLTNPTPLRLEACQVSRQGDASSDTGGFSCRRKERLGGLYLL